jgi:hypothetical protein
VPAFIALRAGLAAVNVVQTAYNAVQVITNVLMAANLVGLVVIAIAPLGAGLVLAYNTLKPFHDAVNTALVLLQELWKWLSGTLASKIGDIGKAISDALGGAFDAVKASIESFIDGFTKVVNTIGGLIAPIPGMSSLASPTSEIADASDYKPLTVAVLVSLVRALRDANPKILQEVPKAEVACASGCSQPTQSSPGGWGAGVTVERYNGTQPMSGPPL